jgi:putative hydrolase of the HAD superfamily
MSKIKNIFFDVGGVILTDGFNHISRHLACQKFNLDFDQFEKRHQAIGADFDEGKIDTDQYMQETVFYEPRPFTKDEFKNFILDQTRADNSTLDLVKSLAEHQKFLLCTLNNESIDLNIYRITKFDLKKYFTAFFSSCFLGIRKPDPLIYQYALNVTFSDPSQSIFIDDRAENLEPAERLGVNCIQFHNASQLACDLKENYGISV